MQVTVTVNTVQQQFAGGTVGGDWLITFAFSSDPSTVVLTYQGASPTTTEELTDGQNYTIKGVRLDAAGAALGPVATVQYQVGTQLVSIDVADTLTVTATPASRSPTPAARGFRQAR